jgi:hypothetical protein
MANAARFPELLTFAQGGRAANQFELPLGTKCPLPLVADLCEKVHFSSGLTVKGGRAANQFELRVILNANINNAAIARRAGCQNCLRSTIHHARCPASARAQF